MKEAEFIEKCKKVIEKYKMKVDIAELTAVLRTMIDYLKRNAKRLKHYKHFVKEFVYSKKNVVSAGVSGIDGIPRIIVIYRIWPIAVAWLTDDEVEFAESEDIIIKFVSAFEDPVYD
jgi:hypothetical protein